MTEEKKFFTRKEERGEKVPDNVVEMQPQGPKVAMELKIFLYEDGNCQVEGPFHDRIAFHGLLALAADTEREMWQRARRMAAQQVAAAAKEPWWKRKMRERAQEKAAKANEIARQEAQRVAEVAANQSRDELSKALDHNNVAHPEMKDPTKQQ